MQPIETRTWKTDTLPKAVLPPADNMRHVVNIILGMLGESPEALRGFMHGMDLVITYMVKAMQEAGNLVGQAHDPTMAAMTKALQTVASLERSPEYAAAVLVGRRMGLDG